MLAHYSLNMSRTRVVLGRVRTRTRRIVSRVYNNNDCYNMIRNLCPWYTISNLLDVNPAVVIELRAGTDTELIQADQADTTYWPSETRLTRSK